MFTLVREELVNVIQGPLLKCTVSTSSIEVQYAPPQNTISPALDTLKYTHTDAYPTLHAHTAHRHDATHL